MLELVKVDDKLSLAGERDFVESVDRTIESIKTFPPTIENLSLCVKKCSELNKQVKEFSEQAEAVKEVYLQPLENAMGNIELAINDLATATKDYGAKVLDLKKQDFKDMAQKRFVTLAGAMSKTGEIPDFETFYDPAWYSRCKTKEALDDAIIAKLKRSEEVEDDKAIATFSIKGSAKIKIVEDFLISSHINYEKI